MYKKFLDENFAIHKEKDVNLTQLFKNTAIIEVIYDSQFADELENFVVEKLGKETPQLLIKFIEKANRDYLITNKRVIQLCNLITKPQTIEFQQLKSQNEESIVNAINNGIESEQKGQQLMSENKLFNKSSNQSDLKTSEKKQIEQSGTPKYQKREDIFEEQIRQIDNINEQDAFEQLQVAENYLEQDNLLEVNTQNEFVYIHDLKLQNSKNNYIIAKVYDKPQESNIRLENALDYFIHVKDKTDRIQMMFIKRRLKEKYFEFYNLMQVQNTYRIENFETSLYNKKLEIKVKQNTQFTLVQEAKIEYIVNQLIQDQNPSTMSEEVQVAGIISESFIQSQYQRAILCTCIEGSNACQKIPLILWDSYKNLVFNPREIIIIKGCRFIRHSKQYEEFELKSINQQFTVSREPKTDSEKRAWEKLNEMKTIWFSDEFQIEQQASSEKFITKQFQIINMNDPVFDVHSNQLIKEITVQEGQSKKKLKLVGDKLSNTSIQVNQLIEINNLQLENDVYLTDPILSQIQNVKQQKIKLKLSKSLGSSTKRSLSQTVSLQEGKMSDCLFNAIVKVEKVGQTQIKGINRLKDLIISDETTLGAITLWNLQILDIKQGQTMLLENIFFDQAKNEFKTSLSTTINLNVAQRSSGTSNVNQFNYSLSLNKIVDYYEQVEQYSYCRVVITDIFAQPVQQRCSLCFNQKVIEVDGFYQCVGEAKHIVSQPKMTSYVRAQIADYTGSLEVIICDELINQYVPQTQMIVDKDISNHFNSIKYQDLILKLMVQDNGKIKKQINQLKEENAKLTTQIIRNKKVIQQKETTVEEIKEIALENESTASESTQASIKIKELPTGMDKVRELYRTVCQCGKTGSDVKFNGFCEDCLKNLKDEYLAAFKQYQPIADEYEKQYAKNIKQEVKMKSMEKKIKGMKEKLEKGEIVEIDTDLKLLRDEISLLNKNVQVTQTETQLMQNEYQRFVKEKNTVQENLEKRIQKKEKKIQQLKDKLDELFKKNHQIESDLSLKQTELAKQSNI